MERGFQISGKFLECAILPSAISSICLPNSWMFFLKFHPSFGWCVRITELWKVPGTYSTISLIHYLFIQLLSVFLQSSSNFWLACLQQQGPFVNMAVPLPVFVLCLDFSFPICTACQNVHEWRGPCAHWADRGMGREMGEKKNPRASCLAPGGISHVAATAELIIDLFELCLPVLTPANLQHPGVTLSYSIIISFTPQNSSSVVVLT